MQLTPNYNLDNAGNRIYTAISGVIVGSIVNRPFPEKTSGEMIVLSVVNEYCGVQIGIQSIGSDVGIKKRLKAYGRYNEWSNF